MSWLSPKALIVIAAAVGLFVWGLPGLVVGLVGGYVLSVVIGLLLNAASGGLLPRSVRRALVTNILLNRADQVRAVYPGKEGADLFKALETELERVTRAAVSIAPTNDTVFAEGVMRRAVEQLVAEETDLRRVQLLDAIWSQLSLDWYRAPR